MERCRRCRRASLTGHYNEYAMDSGSASLHAQVGLPVTAMAFEPGGVLAVGDLGFIRLLSVNNAQVGLPVAAMAYGPGGVLMVGSRESGFLAKIPGCAGGAAHHGDGVRAGRRAGGGRRGQRAAAV